ncbi:hypothetical protein E0K93_18730 [Puniceibacterium sp. HSS470]|uniref:hypothetical protein n=1 Tax=Pseudooceanicola sediminis TaxID=2211117 RepID=UPI0011C46D00|nr:hypothetical protein [Pseudooceanicola sediminis]KAA2312102.1 hypothetical protein E0K93_18730 [Puniceibacterium sp. HSS470]
MIDIAVVTHSSVMTGIFSSLRVVPKSDLDLVQVFKLGPGRRLLPVDRSPRRNASSRLPTMATIRAGGASSLS